MEIQIKYCYTEYVGISYEFNLLHTAFDVSRFETVISFLGFVWYLKRSVKKHVAPSLNI
jgi:hypothetical protein